MMSAVWERSGSGAIGQAVFVVEQAQGRSCIADIGRVGSQKGAAACVVLIPERARMLAAMQIVGLGAHSISVSIAVGRMGFDAAQ